MEPEQHPHLQRVIRMSPNYLQYALKELVEGNKRIPGDVLKVALERTLGDYSSTVKADALAECKLHAGQHASRVCPSELHKRLREILDAVHADNADTTQEISAQLEEMEKRLEQMSSAQLAEFRKTARRLVLVTLLFALGGVYAVKRVVEADTMRESAVITQAQQETPTCC